MLYQLNNDRRALPAGFEVGPPLVLLPRGDAGLLCVRIDSEREFAPKINRHDTTPVLMVTAKPDDWYVLPPYGQPYVVPGCDVAAIGDDHSARTYQLRQKVTAGPSSLAELREQFGADAQVFALHRQLPALLLRGFRPQAPDANNWVLTNCGEWRFVIDRALVLNTGGGTARILSQRAVHYEFRAMTTDTMVELEVPQFD